MKIEDSILQYNFKSDEEKLLVNFIYTYGWLSSLQHHFFKPYGISSQQYNVLRILRGQYKNPVSVGLIQERMMDKMSNASRLIDKLKQKELVQRNECPSDRRQMNILITQKGLDLLKEIDNNLTLINSFSCALNKTEKQTLNNLLDKLRN